MCICEELYQRLKGGLVVLFTFVYQRWMMERERERDVDSIGQDLGEKAGCLIREIKIGKRKAIESGLILFSKKEKFERMIAKKKESRLKLDLEY